MVHFHAPSIRWQLLLNPGRWVAKENPRGLFWEGLSAIQSFPVLRSCDAAHVFSGRNTQRIKASRVIDPQETSRQTQQARMIKKSRPKRTRTGQTQQARADCRCGKRPVWPQRLWAKTSRSSRSPSRPLTSPANGSLSNTLAKASLQVIAANRETHAWAPGSTCRFCPTSAAVRKAEADEAVSNLQAKEGREANMSSTRNRPEQHPKQEPNPRCSHTCGFTMQFSSAECGLNFAPASTGPRDPRHCKRPARGEGPGHRRWLMSFVVFAGKLPCVVS